MPRIIRTAPVRKRLGKATIPEHPLPDGRGSAFGLAPKTAANRQCVCTSRTFRIGFPALWAALLAVGVATQPLAGHPLITLRGTYDSDATAITIRVESDGQTLGHLGLPADADGLDRFARWLEAAIVILDRSGDALAGMARVDQQAGVLTLSYPEASIAWPVSLQLQPTGGGLRVRGQLTLAPRRREYQAQTKAVIITTAGNAVRLDARPDSGNGHTGASSSDAPPNDLLWPELDVHVKADGLELELRAPVAAMPPSAAAGQGDPNRLPADERRALELEFVEWCRAHVVVAVNGQPVSAVRWQARIDVDDEAMQTARPDTDVTLNRRIAVAGMSGHLAIPDLQQVEIQLLPGIGSGSIKADVCIFGQDREGVLTERDPTIKVVIDGASVRLTIGRVEWVLSDGSLQQDGSEGLRADGE
ncbi:MAG: hypothetical protein GY778_05120 [bacterium]|nr:hypothetical protein [bacterium]